MDMSVAEVRIYAADDQPAFTLGLVSFLGTCWWVTTAVIPWPGADNSGLWKHAVWYIWTFTGKEEIFASYLPTAYLASWIVNFFYFLELGAYLGGGNWFVAWAYFGLWGMLALGAVPVAFIVLFIFYEWPLK